jgi:hypothetical protein
VLSEDKLLKLQALANIASKEAKPLEKPPADCLPEKIGSGFIASIKILTLPKGLTRLLAASVACKTRWVTN